MMPTPPGRETLAALEAQEIQVADEQLRDAYRSEPQGPAIVESALRMARESTPPL